MTVPPLDSDEEDAEDVTFNLMKCDWNAVQQNLRSSFQGGSGDSSKMVKVEFRLRPLDDSEFLDGIFEST